VTNKENEITAINKANERAGTLASKMLDGVDELHARAVEEAGNMDPDLLAGMLAGTIDRPEVVSDCIEKTMLSAITETHTFEDARQLFSFWWASGRFNSETGKLVRE